MNRPIAREIFSKTVCPRCYGSLTEAVRGFECRPCGTTYPSLPGGGVNFRLQHPVERILPMTIELPSPEPRIPLSTFPEEAGGCARTKKSGPLPPRMYWEVVERFPVPRADGAMMLDLGCGGMLHRHIVERQGFLYVGLDYANPAAMFQGDARALPFADASFEFILSIAVMQEVPDPALMIREAYRVLVPGGVFIGTTAYLESHPNTYYHFTQNGLDRALGQGGFVVDAIVPNHRWTVPASLMGDCLFPRMPRLLASALVLPWSVSHRLWWRMGSLFNPKATEINRLRLTTGAFFFFAHKPASLDQPPSER